MNVRTPRPAPFLDTTARFASGADSPRAFLERCLDTLAVWEPDIAAFVHLNVEGARAAADRSSARWRAGKPASPIDGMPVGIKDIIETADMPTEMGSPLFVGWRTGRDAAAVMALREAGAVVLGKTVTTEFAASEPRGTRNPWDLTRTPGGSSSGSAAAVAAGLVSAALGTQGIASIIRPASYCGCIGFKPSLGGLNRGGSYDNLSQSCTGVLGATLKDTWQVAREIAIRASGDPGFPGMVGPAQLPAAIKPRRMAIVETAGWAAASPAARTELNNVVERMAQNGISILTRHTNATAAALEVAIVKARPLANEINAWESRWPLNTYRDRDATGLSRVMLERLAKAEALTVDQYRAALVERDWVRGLYAELSSHCDACLTLSATGAAPVGLDWTGDPAFAVPFSLLGAPVISLPLLHEQDFPLGLQVAGFQDGDAKLFAITAWLMQEFGHRA
jgi:Asp-tRNA(Asn)/Glu-tRNA(Gln) amidotransferase A subunit family amidase